MVGLVSWFCTGVCCLGEGELERLEACLKQYEQRVVSKEEVLAVVEAQNRRLLAEFERKVG